MTSGMEIRKYLMVAIISLLVLLAFKATVLSLRESYYLRKRISNPQLLPNYKYILSVSKKIPGNARAILVPDQRGMSLGFYFFEAYYLLPIKIYMYKSNVPYALNDVPKSFLRKNRISWVIYDEGITIKVKSLAEADN